MRVYLGPFKNWVGPYQIADLFQKIGFSEETCDSLGSWLAERTYLVKFLEWINKKRHRKISVKIDDYDTWGMYETLSVIITPMLRQLKETKKSYPLVDNKDVPVELRTKGKKFSEDGKGEAKWDWVLNEMIFAFEQYEARVQVDYDWEEQFQSGEIDLQSVETEYEGMKCYTMEKGPNHTFKIDAEGLKAHQERIQNGFKLFGKYYLNLWD